MVKMRIKIHDGEDEDRDGEDEDQDGEHVEDVECDGQVENVDKRSALRQGWPTMSMEHDNEYGA